MVPNIVKDSSTTPLLASLISHMFQQTYANMVNEVIQQEKLNRCYGCTIQHPNQRQHSCFTVMDKDDSWLYYREDVLEKIDVNAVPNNVESVCNALEYKLGQWWEI